MGYNVQVKPQTILEIELPAGHVLGDGPIALGPFFGILTDSEVMIETLRELGELEKETRDNLDSGEWIPNEELRLHGQYRQHLITLLQEILYDGDEDAEALDCPSSRHELEEEEVPAQEEIPVGTIVWGIFTVLFRGTIVGRKTQTLYEVRLAAICGLTHAVTPDFFMKIGETVVMDLDDLSSDLGIIAARAIDLMEQEREVMLVKQGNLLMQDKVLRHFLATQPKGGPNA